MVKRYAEGICCLSLAQVLTQTGFFEHDLLARTVANFIKDTQKELLES
jgi:hypothetical protein